mmetsp:Transcript_5581/g.18116  ORF Transcript_5581/g.18116 Transcript_5581/m.18116 type:complete len:477 (+) Transcript_5581:628-2058(+)
MRVDRLSDPASADRGVPSPALAPSPSPPPPPPPPPPPSPPSPPSRPRSSAAALRRRSVSPTDDVDETSAVSLTGPSFSTNSDVLPTQALMNVDMGSGVSACGSHSRMDRDGRSSSPHSWSTASATIWLVRSVATGADRSSGTRTTASNDRTLDEGVLDPSLAPPFTWLMASSISALRIDPVLDSLPRSDDRKPSLEAEVAPDRERDRLLVGTVAKRVVPSPMPAEVSDAVGDSTVSPSSEVDRAKVSLDEGSTPDADNAAASLTISAASSIVVEPRNIMRRVRPVGSTMFTRTGDSASTDAKSSSPPPPLFVLSLASARESVAVRSLDLFLEKEYDGDACNDGAPDELFRARSRSSGSMDSLEEPRLAVPDRSDAALAVPSPPTEGEARASASRSLRLSTSIFFCSSASSSVGAPASRDRSNDAAFFSRMRRSSGAESGSGRCLLSRRASPRRAPEPPLACRSSVDSSPAPSPGAE